MPATASRRIFAPVCMVAVFASGVHSWLHRRFIMELVHSYQSDAPPPELPFAPPALKIILVVCWVAVAVVAGFRVRDLGKSGWWALLLLVPVVNLAFLIALCALPGGVTLAADGFPSDEGVSDDDRKS